MERRLAAVMIADVVGYGRLSQIDEEGTRARFHADLREIFEPKIAAYRGRLIKTMGDGLLVEFPSVVDALRCAVEAQRKKAKRNAAAPPEQRLAFRVGVNLGDVIVEGEDIHGDGVNIADRIQALAEPDGVAISGTAYDQVKAKLPVGYASLGEQKVKSIAEPVRVYRVLTDAASAWKTVAAPEPSFRWRWLAAAAALVIVAVGVGLAPWLRTSFSEPVGSPPVAAAASQPSLVVLPFDNLSDDKAQGYLADGITEDLTTELARIPGLFVISRNAAFTYKGKGMPPSVIAKELGVRYLLEGSIRRAGDDIRINAQLIDGESSGHMWAERFDGAWAEVFKLQDDMVEQIATALKLRLVESQRAAQIVGGTSNPAAYDAFLRGLELEGRRTPEDTASAVTQYQQALALDPNFGRVWATLAYLYWNLHDPEQEKAIGITWGEAQDRLEEALRRAEEHPSPSYYQILSDMLVRQQRTDQAIVAAEKAIALDASDPWNYEAMSWALTFNGRAEEGRGFVDAAMRVDPKWNGWRHLLVGVAYFSMDRFENAAASFERIDAKSDGFWSNFYGLMLEISASGHLGQTDKVAALRERLDSLLKQSDSGDFTGQLAQVFFVYKNYADTQRLLEGLQRAGVPELSFGFDPQSQDRLTGDEIKKLAFGHQFEGRFLNTGESYSRTTAADGFTHLAIGLETIEAPSTIEGDTICLNPYPTVGQRSCSAIFRNPGGTSEQKNEYLLFNSRSRFEFSVVKGPGEESAAQAYRSAAEVPHGGTRLHDEAIANLERAIEIEPKNSRDLWSVARWLILAGRTADAQARIETAIGVDPGSEAANCVTAGLLRFEDERFDEAAATLEKCAADHPYDSDTRLLLVATYGHLGRAADAAPHDAKVRAGEPWTIMWAGQRFPFKMPDDARRLHEGLEKAGVAELPEPYDPASGDRLSGGEIRSLVLGHTLNYRNIGEEPGVKASTAFSADGVATLSRPDGDQTGTYIKEWASAVDDRAICISWESFGPECAAVFRNPAGTAVEENEFLWINDGNPWSFSIAK